MKSARASLFPLILLVASLLMGAKQVQARRGFVVITHGDTISELGRVRHEFKPDVRQPSGPPLDHVGFKYGYFGVFFLDLWNWDGEYCVYAEETFYPVSKAVAAKLLGRPESSLGPPFNYRFPIGLDIVLAVGLLRVVPAFLKKKSRIPAYQQYDRGPPRAPRWTPLAPQPPNDPAAPPRPPGGYAPTPPPVVGAASPALPPPLPALVASGPPPLPPEHA